jgi:hypothetical protein
MPVTLKYIIIRWHVDPLLSNDGETSNYTISMLTKASQTSIFPRQRENTAIMEATFSIRPLQDQLAAAGG